MRLVSYNILDGGEGRADPIAEVIEAQSPDIVVLIEADDANVVDRIASRLGMERVVAPGPRHSTAILSRWNILESANHSLLNNQLLKNQLLNNRLMNCCFEATISQPGGNEWALAAVHLHPHAKDADELIRESELRAILDIFLKYRNDRRPHLLVGDFNANSPSHHIDLSRCKQRTRSDAEANGGTIPRRAIKMLLDNGYVDVLHAVQGKAADEQGSFSTQFPGQRVDYVFAYGFEPAQFCEARIEQDRLAQFASDHFPVFVRIE
jgi:endonuclease/exonuclease/phosphatase family metal-dependent hydrolase